MSNMGITIVPSLVTSIIGDGRLVHRSRGVCGGIGRAFTGHFYGHLPAGERAAFVAEGRRVAGELVVVDTARREDAPAKRWERRVLSDGSRHQVYKRYRSADQLACELGGTELTDGRALPPSELAEVAGVSRSTISEHLATLQRARHPAIVCWRERRQAASRDRTPGL
jgi:hypothetical protein